jgi:hypothetical protein
VGVGKKRAGSSTMTSSRLRSTPTCRPRHSAAAPVTPTPSLRAQQSGHASNYDITRETHRESRAGPGRHVGPVQRGPHGRGLLSHHPTQPPASLPCPQCRADAATAAEDGSEDVAPCA